MVHFFFLINQLTIQSRNKTELGNFQQDTVKTIRRDCS